MFLRFLFLSLWVSFSFSQNTTYTFCLQQKDAQQIALNFTICNNSSTAITNDFVFQFQWPKVSNVTVDYGLDVLQNGNSGIVALKKSAFSPVLNPGCSNSYTVRMNYQQGMTVPLTGLLDGVLIQGENCYIPPPYESFECEREVSTDCFVSTTPTGSVKEIKIGEGVVNAWSATREVYIPTNRKTWAIGLGVAHSLFNNLMGFEAISINEYMATALQESNCGCDGGLTAPTWVTTPYPVLPANYCADASHGVAAGFFQMEYGTAWLELSQDIPCFIPFVDFDQFVLGDSFETQIILKTYYDYNAVAYWQYIKGWNAIDFFQNATDPYSVEKTIALAYNRGINAGEIESTLTVNRTAALAATDILPYFTPNSLGWLYAEQISRFTAVLDNNLSAVNPSNPQLAGVTYPGVHQFRNFYDEMISWADVDAYLNKILPMYSGVSVNGALVKAEVQTVFNQINGGNPVSFRYQMNDVVEAIVINLPLFDPKPGLGNIYGNSSSNTNMTPTANMGEDEILCNGSQFTLTVNFAGESPWNFSYQKPDGTVESISNITTTPYVFQVADPGIYKLISVSNVHGTGEVICVPIEKTFSTGTGGITGEDAVCVGAQVSLTGIGNPAGTTPWVSSDTSIATVDNNGLVTGISSGLVTINYYTDSGCEATHEITVGNSALIVGLSTLCEGATTILTGSGTASSSNAWVSSDAAVAMVDGNGLVTAVATGSVTITYTTATGCEATHTLTIENSPTISGLSTLCEGATTILTGSGTASSSNAWVSSDPAVATVDGNGLVTAVATGSVTITYTTATGCEGTQTLTIENNPTISGLSTLCEGATTTLTGSGTASSSNAWVSSDPAVATVDGSGLVTAVATGSVTITYTTATGCEGTHTLTIENNPTISGLSTLCEGATTILTGSGTASSSNAWVSSDPAVATVDGNGLVTAVATGSVTITYTTATGCEGTHILTIENSPTISGLSTLCEGATTILTGSGTASSSNAWVSSDPAVATVDSNGLVTAVATGSVTITYTTAAGCEATHTLTIENTPTISGLSTLCEGATTILTASGTASSSNAWVSSDAAVATVDSNGLVTAVATGSVTITYTTATGCEGTHTLTIENTPTISGLSTLCEGATTILTGSGTASSSNAWVSSDPAVAMVDGSGLVTAVATGSVTITYTTAAGCEATHTLTIENNPTISGLSTLCVGATTVLSTSSFTNGTWQSSDSSIAIIDNLGNVTGITGGQVTLIYTSAIGCVSYFSMTVFEPREPTPQDGKICVDSDSGLGLSNYTIDSGLSDSEYYFEWHKEGILIASASNSFLTVNETGNYTVQAFSIVGDCTSSPVTVTIAPVYTINNVQTTVSELFMDDATLTVIVNPQGGNYWYQVDNLPPQQDNVFTNLTGGVHLLIVEDEEGCSRVEKEFTILNFPKFFTPNGDGINDYWNLQGEVRDLEMTLYIFDRFGKLLKEFKPIDEGWDGTYLGQDLPSTDYWFVAEYVSNEKNKRFNGHFTLKR